MRLTDCAVKLLFMKDTRRKVTEKILLRANPKITSVDNQRVLEGVLFSPFYYKMGVRNTKNPKVYLPLWKTVQQKTQIRWTQGTRESGRKSRYAACKQIRRASTAAIEDQIQEEAAVIKNLEEVEDSWMPIGRRMTISADLMLGLNFSKPADQFCVGGVAKGGWIA